jgi:transcriptional regulator with XRE-family HTH domain
MNALEIKIFREKNKLTQSKLALIVGVGIETVKKWEQGVNRISKSAELLMQQYEEGRMSALQDQSPIVEENTTINYKIPSQMELLAINRQQQEEISKLKSRIIELQEELLVKKNPLHVKDA